MASIRQGSAPEDASPDRSAMKRRSNAPSVSARVAACARRAFPSWLPLVMPLVAAAATPAARELAEILQSTPDVVRGEELYAPCAGCHGPEGSGNQDGLVPALAGQHFSVLARQLVDYRHGERTDVRMAANADRHRLQTAQDIADIAGYLSGLQRRGPGTVGDGMQVRHGASVYFRLCESCHGATGQGDAAEGVPRLAAQHYEYLLRQMNDAAQGRRPNMPQEHVRLLGELEVQDLVGVADYLSRQIAGP